MSNKRLLRKCAPWESCNNTADAQQQAWTKPAASVSRPNSQCSLACFARQPGVRVTLTAAWLVCQAAHWTDAVTHSSPPLFPHHCPPAAAYHGPPAWSAVMQSCTCDCEPTAMTERAPVSCIFRSSMDTCPLCDTPPAACATESHNRTQPHTAEPSEFRPLLQVWELGWELGWKPPKQGAASCRSVTQMPAQHCTTGPKLQPQHYFPQLHDRAEC